jgi:hypothetical protein
MIDLTISGARTFFAEVIGTAEFIAPKVLSVSFKQKK